MNKFKQILVTATCGAFVMSTVAWAETRQVDQFDEVKYALPFDVEFIADDESYVTLEGDQDTIDEIKTKVSGGKLKFSKDSGWFDWSDGDVDITIHYEELSSITMAGSGDGYADEIQTNEMTIRIAGSADLEIDSLECNDLDISISGSGGVKLNEVDADSISTSIAGSGNTELDGSVVSQKVTVSGSGNYNAKGLRSQEAEIKIVGSGNAEVWSLASLEATVMGSGDIDYYGDPTLSKTVHGSGNIEHKGDEP